MSESEYIPAECEAMKTGLQRALASLEALGALVSWSERQNSSCFKEAANASTVKCVYANNEFD